MWNILEVLFPNCIIQCLKVKSDLIFAITLLFKFISCGYFKKKYICVTILTSLHGTNKK